MNKSYVQKVQIGVVAGITAGAIVCGAYVGERHEHTQEVQYQTSPYVLTTMANIATASYVSTSTVLGTSLS